MSTATLGAIASSFLTVRFGAANLSPADTSTVVLALAGALVSAFHLWRVGRHEDRQVRLTALRSRTLGDNASPIRRSSWYRRLGSVVAASPVVGTGEQQRLLRVLAAAGSKGTETLPALSATRSAAPWRLLRYPGHSSNGGSGLPGRR